MAVSVRWDLPPDEALAFFRQKGLKTSFAWADIVGREHDNAFTVAKMMDLDLLADVRAAVDRAIAEGKTLQQFREELEPMLVERGWWGRQQMIDPETGDAVEAQLGSPRRLRTIFHTNMQTAYAAGQWARIEDQANEAPYLMYDAINDTRTRPQHAAWDGKVLRWDHPWWSTHAPLNGWGCRCSVIQLDRQQLDDAGLEPSPEPETAHREWTNPRTGEVSQVPVGIDPGWAYNPGRSRLQRTRQLMSEKARAQGALGATAAAAAEGGRLATLDAALGTGRQRVDEIREAAGSIEAFRRTLRERLNEQRPTGERARTAGRGKAAGLVQEASTWFPDTWTRGADAAGPLYVRTEQRRGWQITIPHALEGKKVRLPKWGRVTGEAGAGYIAAGRARVALHEYVHRLQFAHPELDDYFQRLHERRTGGETPQSLATLTRKPFPASERAQPDDYVDPYTGKVYPSTSQGEYRGRAGALEVMTTAYEKLLVDSRDELERYLDSDRELLDLAVGLLFEYEP